MTNAEAKQAFYDGKPIIYKGVRYDEVKALIYRKDREKNWMYLSVELYERRSNCVVVALPKNVERVEGQIPK